jgi:hypothetical protein
LLVAVVSVDGHVYPVDEQLTPVVLQVGVPPPAALKAAMAAALAAASVAVCAAPRLKYAHPISTTSPTIPSSGTIPSVNINNA